jgi:hypothetical protein
MLPIHLLLVLLNYFWLSWDPKESASWYCDQHCFKIGSEVMESVWDAVLVLSPELSELATKEGIPQSHRKRRHSKEGCLWHPLSVWNGLTRANMHRSLINADAIFKEHKKRKGTSHVAWKDCKFLLKNINKINFNSSIWKKWFASQNGDEDSKYRPSKTKVKDLQLRAKWCSVHAFIDGTTVFSLDRNSCGMTEPPQCINDKLFPNCKVSGDPIQTYRNYYHLKTNTVSSGMRYFYTKPPKWLKGNVQTERKTKAKKKPVEKSAGKWLIDKEGFVVVKIIRK